MTISAPDSSAEVLVALREQRRVQDAADVEQVRLAVRFAAFCSADSIRHADTLPGTERAVRLGGEGTPEVAEFAVAEFAAALGRSLDAARMFLAESLELVHRLRRTWARVEAGDLPAWQARRVAAATMGLPAEGASWVDAQVAPVAGRIGPAALGRVIERAMALFDPEAVEARALDALDERHLDIVVDRVLDGGVSTARVDGVLDVADALDLEAAIADVAGQLAAWGSQESLDVRRARALGELARHQLALALGGEAGGGDRPGEATVAGRRPTRQVALHVHLSDAAIRGSGRGIATVESLLGLRDVPVNVEQIQDWCDRAATVVVRPVLDLAATLRSAGYEPSATLREQVVLRDGTCIAPHCDRPARSADLDHIEPYGDDGGETSSQNLAALCRPHHRAKTSGGWSYTMLEPGIYLWRLPSGLRFLRTPSGTTDITDLVAGVRTERHRPRP